MTTRTQTRIVGYYNEQEYSVDMFSDDEPMGVELYRAGNSPYDSQQYVSIEDGVGLETMKLYCEQTSKDIAKEQGAKFVGIEYKELS